MTNETWNKEDAVEWAKRWKEPEMRKGLAKLEAKTKVSGAPQVLQPGYDGIALSAMEHSFKQGQQSILDEIERMGVHIERKDIGPAFHPNKPPNSSSQTQ